MPSEQKQTLYQTIIQIVKEKEPNSVKELVDLTKAKLPIPEQEIIEAILKLQSQKQIVLSKPEAPAPENFAAYITIEQATWFWITLATAFGTLAAVFLIPETLTPWVYIRYILGSVYVLWLPGYTFLRALFPITRSGKNGKSLDTTERIALSIGMSLALVPLTGLLLNYTPWGIRLAPIVLSLLALTLIFSAVALTREYQSQKRTEQQ